MTTITKATCSNFRADLTAALATIGAKYGMAFSGGNIRFSPSTLSLKVTGVVKVAGATGAVAATVEAVALTRYIAQYGSPVKTLDTTKYYEFGSNVGFAKVIGYIPRRFKYPFVVQTASGRRFKVSSMTLQAAIARGGK